MRQRGAAIIKDMTGQDQGAIGVYTDASGDRNGATTRNGKGAAY